MLGRSFLFALVLTCSIGLGAKPLGPERNFETLIRHVLWYGSSEKLQDKFAQPLGIAATNVPVHRFLYHEKTDALDHMFMVTIAPFYRRLVLIASIDPNDGSGVMWSVAPDGALDTTIAFAGGAVLKVPNEEFHGQFAAEKEYHFRKLDAGGGALRHPKEQM